MHLKILQNPSVENAKLRNGENGKRVGRSTSIYVAAIAAAVLINLCQDDRRLALCGHRMLSRIHSASVRDGLAHSPMLSWTRWQRSRTACGVAASLDEGPTDGLGAWAAAAAAAVP